MSFSKISITRMLVYSFSFLIFTYLAFSTYLILEIRTLSGFTQTIYDHPLVVSNAALQANVSITKMHRNMKDVVLFSSSTRIKDVIQQVNKEEALVYEHLEVVRERILGEEGLELERQARILFDQWRPIRKQVIMLVQEGQNQKAAEITIGKGADHVSRLEAGMLALTNYARTKAATFMAEAEEANSRIVISALILLIFSTLLASVIAIFTWKRTSIQESEIRRSRQLLENAVDRAPIGMVMVGQDGRFFRVNTAFCDIIGYTHDELVTKNFQDITHPEDKQVGEHGIHDLVTGRIDKTVFEQRYIKKDGSVIHVYLTTTLLRETNGAPLYFLTQVQDITVRKLAVQRIEHLNRVLCAIRDVNQLIVREQDANLLIREACQLLVDNRGYSSVLLMLMDARKKLVSWAGAGIASHSDELESLLNKHKIPPCYDLVRSTSDVVVVDDRKSMCAECPLFNKCFTSPSMCIRLEHENIGFGYMVVALDHYSTVDEEEKKLFAEMAGDLAYALHNIQTNDERKKSEHKSISLENQLLQSQKMESIGRLAGGVAHDYNNMLTIIMGYAELAIEKLDPEKSLYGDLEEIYKAAQRSSEITRQLLAFARKQITLPKIIDINKNVENMLKMLRRLIGEDIDLAWLPAANVSPIKMDPVQVDQVLANLCLNARDAIDGVGQVTIETANAVFDEEYCIDHAEFIPGEYVMLAVSDNGRGIDPKNVDKIFEPFFTTKGLHKGTGLGLSTVYGIIKQNEGFINVYSEVEKGTTIKCYFPHFNGQAVEAFPEPVNEIPLAQDETVLLVEDDASILKLGSRMLKSLGYKVVPANTVADAIENAGHYEGKIDLLLTDVIMPEMNGRELNNRIQALRPMIKTLFMSGYTANVIAHRGVLDEDVFFIQKPLSKKELAIKLRQVLAFQQNDNPQEKPRDV